jgi:flavodoxin/NAD-dependent dihydropyrimidine dehydrogenase PreA subunit
MKALIIHFSQTGNTRRIAECIHQGILDAGGACDLQSMRDVETGIVSHYDLVGIGAPVFYYKEPFNVMDFITALPDLDGQPWLVFCTHGNVIGNFFPSITEELRKRGAQIIGYHNTYADITVTFYPKHSYTSGHPDIHDLESAKSFGVKICKLAEKVYSQQQDTIYESFPISSEEWIEDSHRLTREALKANLPKLTLNMDTCIRCGECEEECPVQGIDVGADPPRIQDPCIYCFRCVNVCSTLSIQGDWEPLVRMAPANYKRYRDELDKVAARGEFRWLMDPDTIDLSMPLYKQRERELGMDSKPNGDRGK